MEIEIDIIDYDDAQYMEMTEAQIEKVRLAQHEKNLLMLELNDSKRREKNRLLKNGVFRSELYDNICAELDAKYEAEVNTIRQGLLFYLRFTIIRELEGVESPYPLDFSLPENERATVVLDYYRETYSDDVECFEAFKADPVAKYYLGEYYVSLYSYFKAKAEGTVG